MRLLLCTVFALFLTTAAFADVPKDGDIKLLPWPQKIDRVDGSLQLTKDSRIVATDPKFVDRKMGDHWQRQWLIVARRSVR